MGSVHLNWAFFSGVPLDDLALCLNAYAALAAKVNGAMENGVAMSGNAADLSQPLGKISEAALTNLLASDFSGKRDTPGLAAVNHYRKEIEAFAKSTGISFDLLAMMMLDEMGPVTAHSDHTAYRLHLDCGGERRTPGSAEPIGHEIAFEYSRGRVITGDDIELPNHVVAGLWQWIEQTRVEVAIADFDGASLWRDTFGGQYVLHFGWGIDRPPLDTVSTLDTLRRLIQP